MVVVVVVVTHKLGSIKSRHTVIMSGNLTVKVAVLTSRIREWCMLRIAFCAHSFVENTMNAQPDNKHISMIADVQYVTKLKQAGQSSLTAAVTACICY